MGDAKGPAERLAPDEVDARCQLWAALPLSAFPAGRDSLLPVAQAGQAPTSVIEALEGLPLDSAFDSAYDVSTAIGASTSPSSLGERS
jgi:hypothetical protein